MNALPAQGAALAGAAIRPFADRSSRVIVLLGLIAIMSVVDLYLTILYITHTGMNEVNPLARAMMEYKSPALLGLWKLATVTLGVGILIVIRRRRSAEIGAWVGCAVLGLLMNHWLHYIEEHERITTEAVMVEAMGDPTWVHLGPAPVLASPARSAVP